MPLLKKVIIGSCLALCFPAYASEPTAQSGRMGDIPASWAPILAIASRDLESRGIDLRCHTMGLLANQTVTVNGEVHEGLFLVATGYGQEYYETYGNGPFTKYKCGSLYQYYIDQTGKIISRKVRKE